VIALALLAAATAQPVPAEDEIVVLARKMRFIEIDVKAPRRKGMVVMERCRVTKGSGNAELDAVPCDVARECMTAVPESRKALGVCIEANSQPRLDALVARWRSARVATQ